MDKTYIDERHVVDKYLQGKLAGDELAAFEVYMLDHPEILDDIEYARGMQEALTSAKDELFADVSSQAISRIGFWSSRGYAMVATVLLAVAITSLAYLYLQTGGLREEIAELQNPIPITGEVWLESVRGIDERVIERRKGTALVLRVDVSAAPAVSYTAELRGIETDFRWSRSQINPDDEQSIRLLLSGLPAAEYQLSISTDDGVNPSVSVAEHRFLLQQPEE